MDRGKRLAGAAGRQAHASARAARPWLVAAGRCGYAAEGAVYLLIGTLALGVALGRGGALADNKGALTRIAAAPFGRALLLATALGLAGYALWSFLRAALDTDGKGGGAAGIAQRLGHAGVGVLHVGLALSALRLLRTGDAGATSDAVAKDWTARLLAHPAGPALVALAGLGTIGFGTYQVYKACRGDLREEPDAGAADAPTLDWVVRLGRAGYAARGAVFALNGAFLLYAARRHDPGQARGLDGVLATLAAQPLGPWLLGAVAAGLAAHGLFLLAEARYRRMVIA